VKPLLPEILSCGPDDEGRPRVAICFKGRGKGDSVEFATLTAKGAKDVLFGAVEALLALEAEIEKEAK